MIAVKNVSFSYEKIPVLKDISFDFFKGKITTILGPNGSGKSTLLHLLGKMLELQNGQIYLDLNDIRNLKRKELSQKLAIVFQQNTAPLDLTVKDLVAYGRNPHKGYFEQLDENDWDIVDWALEVTELKDYAEKPVANLSGGERQRVWVALALAQTTDVLLLDEPTTYLDVHHQIEILEVIQNINRAYGKTIIMVLHDLNLAIKYSDYIVFMKNGRLVTYGEPEKIITENIIQEIYGVKSKIYKDGKDIFVNIKGISKEDVKDENIINVFQLNG